MKLITNIMKYFMLRHKNRKRKKLKNYNGIFRNSTNFFLIMPQNEDDFKAGLKLIKYLQSLNKGITVFLKAEHVALLPVHGKYRIEEYSDQDINKFKLPVLQLRQKLRILVFDTVIDLNREENLFCSVCSNLVNADNIISFSKSDGEQYYNLQFTITEHDSERSYANFLNCLQMF